MEVAKLQIPTTRKRKGVADEKKSELKDTVEEWNGDVVIEKIEFTPTSAGRERFGSGTTHWPRFSLTWLFAL